MTTNSLRMKNRCAFTVHELVIGEDVRGVPHQYAGDGMNQPALVRAVHEQYLWRLAVHDAALLCGHDPGSIIPAEHYVG